MTDKPKKFKVTKRVYNKVEDTYWEEFEMTQDNWNSLIDLTKQHYAESIVHLQKKMTEKTEDWELLYIYCLTVILKMKIKQLG